MPRWFLVLVFFGLESAPCQAEPEWTGATCQDYGADGRRPTVHPDQCRELYPTHYEFSGCTCFEFTPGGFPVTEAGDPDLCPGPKPSCNEAGSLDGVDGNDRISRPDFLSEPAN